MKTLFHCEPEYVAPLRAAGLLDFDFLMSVKGGPASSRHANRETIPLDIEVEGRRKRFFLKRVFKVPPKHAIVPLFQRRPNWSQPRREWEMLGKLAEADIAAMKRVAYGERRRLGVPMQALILVEAVPLSVTLENWVLPGFARPFELSAAQRHRLAYELAWQLFCLHGAGFRWPDLHPKHIYAAPSPGKPSGNPWQFFLIDVERMEGGPDVRAGIPITDSGMLDDLLIFRDLRWFFEGLRPLAVTGYDLRCFWAGYCRGLRQMYRKDRQARQCSRQPMPKIVVLEPRPRLPDGYEHPHASPLQRFDKLLFDPRVAPHLARLGWRDVDDVFSYRGGQDLSKPGLGSSRERSRIELSEGNGSARAYYLKRYDSPPLPDQLRRIREFRRSRSTAAREVHFIKRLARLGIPTLQSVAYGEEMAGVWERRSFVVTAELPGQSLEKFVAQWAAEPATAPSPAERREIIRQLGLIVRLLHAEGLFHRDLYLAHVFLSHNSDGQVVLHLIDLARMIGNPWSPHRWAVKDLAALAYSAPAPLVTRTDRFRFLYHYLGDQPQDEKKREARRFALAVEAKARRIARHDRKRKHRLLGAST